MIRLASLADVQAALETHRGSRFLVNHFATWCEPCVEEIPLLVELRRRLPSVPFLGVSWELFMGWEEPAETLQRLEGWLPEQGIDFPVLLYTGTPPDLFAALGIPEGTIPHTVVYGEGGEEMLAVPRPLVPQDLEVLEAALVSPG